MRLKPTRSPFHGSLWKSIDFHNFIVLQNFKPSNKIDAMKIENKKRKDNPYWVKRNFPEVAGGGLAAGGAAVPTIVTVAGGGASCAGITGGLAALGGGTMLGGLITVAAIPIACGITCLGVGYVVKRSIWG